MTDEALLPYIQALPSGYSQVTFQDRTYRVVREDFNAGRSIKVLAEELGGTDFISFNFYRTSQAETLKPCEMPAQKVVSFLEGYELEQSKNEPS